MLKLKLQYFGHLMRKVDSLEKILMLGGVGSRRIKRQPRMRWLDGIASKDVSLSELRKTVMNREVWRAATHGGSKKSNTSKRLNRTECLFLYTTILALSSSQSLQKLWETQPIRLSLAYLSRATKDPPWEWALLKQLGWAASRVSLGQEFVADLFT